jgi:hypothetical protein
MTVRMQFDECENDAAVQHAAVLTAEPRLREELGSCTPPHSPFPGNASRLP